MPIYPLVPLERSLDGQIWHPMTRADVRAFFCAIHDYYWDEGADECRRLTTLLERGETVQVLERFAIVTCWMRSQTPSPMYAPGFQGFRDIARRERES